MDEFRFTGERNLVGAGGDCCPGGWRSRPGPRREFEGGGRDEAFDEDVEPAQNTLG
jgi:hypothetical protein